jgi:hypothetical protein
MGGRRMKKRRRSTLTRKAAIERMNSIFSLIEDNVRIAVDVEATLEEANIAIKKLSIKNFSGANCYNTLKQCMVLELAIVAARLFDKGGRKKRNKSDVAAISLLVHFLRQKRCRDFLADSSRNWTPQIPSLADSHERACRKSIEEALKAYSDLVRSPGGRKALRMLRGFRNIKLAHTLVGKILRGLPTYNDLFQMIEMARYFTTKAKLALTGTNTDYVEIGRIRRDEAEYFWKTALEALVKADLEFRE